jgi:hypothetical protein
MRDIAFAFEDLEKDMDNIIPFNKPPADPILSLDLKKTIEDLEKARFLITRQIESLRAIDEEREKTV